MSLAFTNIPLGYDIDFIASKAGASFEGQHPKADHTRVYYPDPDGTKFELVSSIVANYDEVYVEKRLPERIAEVQALREVKIGSFAFAGVSIELDLETKANLTGAVSGLDRNPSVTGLDWSLGGGEFVYLTREAVYDMADAAFLHVQSCFSHARTLVGSLKEMTTCAALDAVDISAGWPDQA